VQELIDLACDAPDDETRSRIIPMNRRYGVGEIMKAARRFQERTGRIVTIEYCLLNGVNDSDGHARTLADLMGDFRAHVNLIPYNAIGVGVSGKAYAAPGAERVREFLNVLMGRGVVVHLRQRRGDDVNAACGQLRETTVFRP
jgi:23S rRNA (adenine2503-C2)-methyltransferase